MPLTKPRAYQIYDIDYKQSVRVVTISNVTLSGGAPNSVDGVNLSLNDRILVTGQTNPVQNGIYYVTTLGAGSNGTWARSIDTDTTGELDGGTIVMVTEGLIYADTQWKLITNDPIVIGTTGLTFIQNYSTNSISAGTSNVIVNSNSNVTISSAGTANVVVVTSAGANIAGAVRATGDMFGKELWSTQSSGDEGGQVNLGIPATNTSLTGQVTVDVYQNKLRFFQGDSARGAYIDLTQAAVGVGTNLLAGGGGGTPGGANTQVQFNDGGLFGGNAQFTYNKVTNLLTVGNISANSNGSGTNYAVGDDAWIGDINQADTISIRGQQNAANGYIVFGNASVAQLGRAGTGPLTYSGAFSASGNVTGGNILTGGIISATGNVNGGNLNITGDIFDTGPLRIITAASGSIALAPNSSNVVVVSTTGAAVTGTMSASGTVTGAGIVSTSTITTAGNITTSGANGVANIGAVGAFFNTVHARATSAQYADVAEYYSSDRNYEPGTVIIFGGNAEVTLADQIADDRVAGVVSTNPAYIMNAGIQSEYSVPVALTGRVPTRVLGPVNKGSMMISAGNGYARACSRPTIGTVIGKSLENFSGTEGIIEIVVGRM